MCSVASLILFSGLVTVLLYQAIQRRNIEVHRVKPANAPDLLSFVNVLEFHITTISSMSCAQLVAPSTIAMGTPGFMDFRVVPLSTFLTYNCQNTSQGPSVSLKCNGCRIPPRDHYVSWQFIDLPRQPASAVGFQFNLTAKQHGDDKHMSFVSGTINSDNYADDKMKTFRGLDSNVLKIQLFPQIYNNHHNLKLLQPLVQDFTQGSTFSDVSSLNASLQNPRDGVINTTLYISYLSDYIVEISNENVLGPVSVLASIGGLYAFSVAIFLCLMAQCEARIKKLRDEDTRMLKILSKRRAQRNWDKVRKFVMYTWGPSNLDPSDRSGKWPEGSMMDSLHGSFHKRRKPIRRATSNANKPNRVPADTVQELASLVRDNLYSKHLVLSTEEALVTLLRHDDAHDHDYDQHRGTVSRNTMELQPASSYHRLLLHRLADIYGFAHESVGEGEDRHLVLRRCPETAIPPVLVSDVLWQYDGNDVPTSVVLTTNATDHQKVWTAEDFQEFTSVESSHLKADTDLKPLQQSVPVAAASLREREAAYRAARERIFSAHDAKGKDTSVAKPRHVPVVAQRMIAHALGKKVENPTETAALVKDKGKEAVNGPNIPTASRNNSYAVTASTREENYVGKGNSSSTGGDSYRNPCTESKTCRAEKLKKEQTGAAKRMFAHALRLPAVQGAAARKPK